MQELKYLMKAPLSGDWVVYGVTGGRIGPRRPLY